MLGYRAINTGLSAQLCESVQAAGHKKRTLSPRVLGMGVQMSKIFILDYSS